MTVIVKSGDPNFEQIRGAIITKTPGDGIGSNIVAMPFGAETTSVDTGSDSAVMHLDANSDKVLSAPTGEYSAFQVIITCGATAVDGDGTTSGQYTFGKWTGDITIEPDGTVNGSFTPDANNNAARATFTLPTLTIVDNVVTITVGHTGDLVGVTETIKWNATLNGQSNGDLVVIYLC